MFQLKRYLRPYLKETLVGPFFKSFEAVIELFIPLVMAQIIDVGVNGGEGKTYIYRMGLFMLLLYVVSFSVTMICQYMGSKASQGVGTTLRNDLFKHINMFSHAEFDKFGTASLVTRLTNDINQLQVVVALGIRLGIRLPILIIGAIIMAMRINLQLAIVFLVVGPLVLLVIFFIMKKSLPYYRKLQKKNDRISLISRENLEGVRVIRAFSRQDGEKERFDETNTEYKNLSLRVGRISALLNPATFFIMNIAVAIIVWYGGQRVDAGILSQGEVIAFVSYMTQILLAIVVLAMLINVFAKGSTSAARINEVFETKPSIQEKTSVIEKAQINRDTPMILFQNVAFSYYPDAHEYALDDLNFDIRKGEKVGIIGGTGSGKTTLASLIPRFYDVTSGKVLLNGIEVQDYSLKKLRQCVGVVQQNPTLFSGTVKDVLQMGRDNVTMADIEEAAEIAQAKDFIEQLPDHYDSLVMQGGKNFSGGQRQRLAIARTLAGKPEVLILDDSASALDFATDAALRRALQQKVKSTTIVISQRINTVRYLERIIVLDEGKIVGIGTHDALLETCTVYREIYHSQVRSEEVQ